MTRQVVSKAEIERALHRSLTVAQRLRHLERLDHAIVAEEHDMEFLKRRNRTEIGLLAAASAVVVICVIVWATILSDSNTADGAPTDLVAAAAATLTARQTDAPTTANTPSSSPANPESVATQQRSTAGVGACAVDEAATVVPPLVPQGDPMHSTWYGSETTGLWVSPSDPEGLLPIGIEESSGSWFAGGTTYLMWFGTALPVRLSGVQLDGSAKFGPIDGTDQFNQIQWTNFSFPEPGCWELEASTGEESFSLTVSVLPIAQRADVIYLQQRYEARPYEIPSTCSTTPLAGPEERYNYNIVQYWLDVEGVSASIFEWPVANQQLTLGVFGDEVPDALVAKGRNLATGLATEASTSIWNTTSRLVRYTFPSHGCWELELTTATTTTSFVIYVYPEDCLPEFRDDRIHVACEEPLS